MPERRVTIGSAIGLHARPASIFVKAVAASPVPVTIGKPGGDQLDARSILAVLALGARHGEEVVLRAEGDDADDVLEELALLLAQDLDAPH